MTAPDHMSETFKNCLHETGHPHMGLINASAEEFATAFSQGSCKAKTALLHERFPRRADRSHVSP
jgi:hypothetical protein